MTEEPVRCNKCNSIMDRIETCDLVTVSYSYDNGTKEYEQVDIDWQGNSETKYTCPDPECGTEIEA